MTVPEKVAAANQKVIEIMTKGRPVWTDVKPALEGSANPSENCCLRCRLSRRVGEEY